MFNQDLVDKKKIHKIAIIAPVPFYYHVPLYRKLADFSGINLTVYYCSNETLHGADIEKTYNSKGEFTDKEDLLRGYYYKFLKNYSRNPSYLRWPFGLVNFGIWKEIKSGDYDVVVLQSWTNLTWWVAFFACLKFHTPILFMTDSNVAPESLKSKIKIFIKKIILGKFLFTLASGFLTSGVANERFYKFYGVPEKKMVRLYFSWGYEKFLEKSRQISGERNRIRKSLGLSEEDFMILYVGRLAQEKAPLLILDAYRMVENKNKKLFIVGDGPIKSEFGKYIRDFNIEGVKMVGFQSQEKISPFYVAADVLVLPSFRETWGIVVSEAMCFGLPIIVSDSVGAAVDLVRHGYNGFIFPSGNAKKFYFCIKKLINMSSEERIIFGQRSSRAVEEWINAIDPVGQIIKMLAKIKNKS